MKLSTQLIIAAIAGGLLAVIGVTIFICVGGDGEYRPHLSTLGGSIYTRGLPKAKKIALDIPNGGQWGQLNGVWGVRIIGSDTIASPLLEATEKWQQSLTDSITPDGTLLITWNPDKIRTSGRDEWEIFESTDSIPVTLIVPRGMLEEADVIDSNTNLRLCLDNLTGRRLRVSNNNFGLGVSIDRCDLDTLDLLPGKNGTLALDSTKINVLNLNPGKGNTLKVETEESNVATTFVTSGETIDLSGARLGKVILTGETAQGLNIIIGQNQVTSL